MSICIKLASAMLATLLATGSVNALGADVTPGVVFGDGVTNGGFKVETAGALELGLRAKLRYDTSGDPQNTFPFDGVDTYTFDPADGNAPSGKAIWNFEWSIFTGMDGSKDKLSDYHFNLGVTAPDGATASINPTNLFLATLAPSGIFQPKNIAQGSQNVGFDLDDASFLGLGNGPDWPLAAAESKGTFTFSLTASKKDGTEVLSNNMNVNVIPVPAALPLLGGVFAIFGVAGWRKRRSAA